MTLTTDTHAEANAPVEAARLPHRQHPIWWLAVAFVMLCLGGLVKVAVTNPNLQWGVVADYMFNSSILTGLLRTVELTVLAMVFGIAIGVVTAVMRLSPIKILSGVA
jgi:polar amino acid transport system permease protein